jgi:hypothetical protein
LVIDTPGLADIKTEETAAEEIEKALKNPEKRVKINFVVDLNAGRVDTKDIETINAVCTVHLCSDYLKENTEPGPCLGSLDIFDFTFKLISMREVVGEAEKYKATPKTLWFDSLQGAINSQHLRGINPEEVRKD